MMGVEPIELKTSDPCINIALDTLKKGKQSLYFVNTRPSAEKVAESISKKCKDVDHPDLEEAILSALPRPTVQCKRLASCVKRGIAFHHSGLVAKQRELIEREFKNGRIKIISATPTLAIGVDLPAFRAVIRDLKRFGGGSFGGMQNIPVLEYQQMAGRAGRPSYDAWGEAITIAKSQGEKEDIVDEYIEAESEDIYSKLAVEPVLRTYVLSLIATRFVKTKQQIIDFFQSTFWAHQYKDMDRLTGIIEKMLALLLEWKFITKKGSPEQSGGSASDDALAAKGFVSADTLSSDADRETAYVATPIGKRVAELYLDPYTANHLIVAMKREPELKRDSSQLLFAVLQMISQTIEMAPLLRVKQKEYDDILGVLSEHEDILLVDEPSAFDILYEDFLNSIKTSAFFVKWCNESDEEQLLEEFNVRPGEIKAKIDRADWLLYSCVELVKLLDNKPLEKELIRVRTRVLHGVREELIVLLKLKGIGRVRARKLYSNNLKTLSDIRRIDQESLAKLIGKQTAATIKEQLGQEVAEPVSERKRIGQMSLSKYD